MLGGGNLPVGMTHRTSRPRRAAEIAGSCCPRKLVCPKYRDMAAAAAAATVSSVACCQASWTAPIELVGPRP
eukprot:scaffold1169_cov367-Prasinococcus_capsulatus_cf.AAC.5